MLAVFGGCTYSTGDPQPVSTETLPALQPEPAGTAPPDSRPRPTTTTSPPSSPPRPPRQVVLRRGGPTVRVIERRGAAALAVATSRALIASSPAVVVAFERPNAIARAGDAAARLGIPLLVAGERNATSVGREVTRLRARTVLGVGRLPPAVIRAFGRRVDVVDVPRRVPKVRPAAPRTAGAALVTPGDESVGPAAVTAGIAGLRTVAVRRGDPRITVATRRRLERLAPRRIIALGAPGAFPAARVLGALVRTAASGRELPGGGQLLFPGRRVVAIYGHPGDDNLGVLGEQPVRPAVQRARRVAAPYARLDDQPVVPAFELIATVASSEAGADRDFSVESSVDDLRPWVDAAAAAGLLVVLDLQPGRTDFLTQALRYAELLRRPHVGLALDPEWRLARGQRHLRDIGSVSATEVNRVASWLAALTRRHALPQKLLIVHQFRLAMIRNRSRIRTHPELALVFQMDGQGPQHLKLSTWRAVVAGGPRDARFGWKNFYDEDRPLRSPAATRALRPSPVFVSYQ